jgi:hypothetical protein
MGELENHRQHLYLHEYFKLFRLAFLTFRDPQYFRDHASLQALRGALERGVSSGETAPAD